MSLEKSPLEERQSLANLAVDIVRDAQRLFEQQVALTKRQLFEDWTRARPVALWIALGFVALCVVSILSACTIVFLLNKLSGIDLWICFAIVDLALLLVAAFSFLIARSKLKGVSVING
jgi:hypothetical protein